MTSRRHVRARHSPCKEQANHSHVPKLAEQNGTDSSIMGARRQHVVDDRDHSRFGPHQVHVDAIARHNLIRSWALPAVVCRRGARRLDNQFADIQVRLASNPSEHSRQSVVVERIALRFRGRDGDERKAIQRVRVQGVSKRVRHLIDRPTLELPVRERTPVHRLLEFDDQPLGRVERPVLLPRELADMVAGVVRRQIPVTRPRQIVDSQEPTPTAARGSLHSPAPG